MSSPPASATQPALNGTPNAASAPTTSRSANALPWSGFLLGFALGGFFDGILLHQILQWHHLLSGLQGEAFRDLHVQVMADGYFHALMYVVAAAGLWRMWQARAEFARPGSGSRLLRALLIGFGVWHVVDAVLFHWLLGIHHIRMDTDNRVLWDIAWLAAFGLVPLAISRTFRSGSDAGPGSGASVVTRALPLVIAVCMVGAGLWALRPPPGPAFTTVLFAPGVTPAESLATVAALDKAIAWADDSGRLVVIATPPWHDRWRLYGKGAILVSGAGIPAGCFAWRGI